MKQLSELLLNTDILESHGNIEVAVSDIAYDTRKAVAPGSVFVATRGTTFDGHSYIDQAIDAGAVAVVCEEFPKELREGVAYIRTGSTHYAIAHMSEAYFGYPSRQMKLVGVTGTNGKTTVATLLFSFFRARGLHALLLSTVENKIDDEVFPASHTTPDPYDISRMLALALERGVTHAAMEVSSHAIDQGRISGLTFAGGLFTNITHDHLDYHETFENYARAKKQFFDGLTSDAFALSNRDDKEGEWMLKNTQATKYLYSLRDEADFKGDIVSSTLSGLDMSVNGAPLHVPLIGAFNAYNTLAVYGALVLLGIDESEVRETLSKLTPPRGRLEFVTSPTGVVGVVDFAHTPDALENVLKTLQGVATKRIITLCGCGGDRDPFKRPIMGDIAHEFSSYSIFTSDNPRSEDPALILEAMTERLPDDGTWEIVIDRHEAIERAVAMAEPGDILLVAGKGHEDYQIVKGVKNHFSDMEELKKNFHI
jgi:UDP-N-acetylmuramoyl-L-alanyl-D-glutamate--2,6-diaminopimelate ligase